MAKKKKVIMLGDFIENLKNDTQPSAEDKSLIKKVHREFKKKKSASIFWNPLAAA